MLLLGGALLLRVILALRPGLWGDEIFSLAMATGHSLEHPAASADRTRGDFVQAARPEPASAYRRYVAHTNPPAGPGAVTRAVFISDTSPPLYYLVLNGWTRLFGTSDAALRLFSLMWAVLAAPFIWLIARHLGDENTAHVATVLYAWSPVSVFYSTEGRMYSLVWFLVAALAWQSLRLARRGPTAMGLLAWVAIASAGLYTHYFFLFVWLAIGAWLLLWSDTLPRISVGLALAASVAAAAPWYVKVPGALAQWRVTGDWLAGSLHGTEIATRPFELAWSLLAGGSQWGGSPRIDAVMAFGYLGLGLWILRRKQFGELLRRDRMLVWGWVAAAILGVYIFDLVRGSSASRVPRYVLAGLPAAMILVAIATATLAPRIRAAFVAFVLVAWTAGLWPIITRTRPAASYRAIAADLERWAGPDDLIIAHSIPSGVIALGRYLTRDLPLAAWVEPLGLRRVPDDVEQLVAGHRRVALVQVHNLSRPSPALPWLRQHARLTGHRIFDPVADSLTADPGSLAARQRAIFQQGGLFEIFYFDAPDDGPFPIRR